MDIRPYADADFDAVTEIWLTSWRSTGVPAPVTLEELRTRWPLELAKGWRVHVAVEDGEILGFAGLKDAKLEQLFVAPRFQGHGVGKKLLDFVKTQMPGGFSLDTARESRAPAFYEREGLVRGETGTHPRLGHSIVIYRWQPASGSDYPMG